MKKGLLLCLFLAALTMQTQAQEETNFKNETIEFLKLTGAGDAFEKAIEQIGAMVSEVNKDAFTKEAQATLPSLYEKMAVLYMEVFTQDEIHELVDFYNTDLGKKLAGKQFELTQKAMLFGQNWGMEVQSIAQKYN